MKILWRSSLLLFCALASARASRQETPAPIEISASATARVEKDGSVAIRHPTNDELSGVEASADKFAEVDRLYPGNDPPKGISLSKATEVLPPGVIKLSDGRTILLDGIHCSVDGIKNISHLALFDGVSIAFVPSSLNAPAPVPAQVWLVDPPLSDSSFGPSYSPIAEVALANGWCSPSPTSTNKYNDRYEALAKIFVGH